MEAILREAEHVQWEGFVKWVGFKPKWKSEGVMVDKLSGELTEENDVTGKQESQR